MHQGLLQVAPVAARLVLEVLLALAEEHRALVVIRAHYAKWCWFQHNLLLVSIYPHYRRMRQDQGCIDYKAIP